MDLIRGYTEPKQPDLDAMSQEERIGLVHSMIHLIEADRLLSEAVFHYTPAEMDDFIRLIQTALSARQGSKPHMIELIEVLYGDPSLRELWAASRNVPSQRLHKRARHGGRRKTHVRRQKHRRGSRRR